MESLWWYDLDGTRNGLGLNKVEWARAVSIGPPAWPSGGRLSKPHRELARTAALGFHEF